MVRASRSLNGATPRRAGTLARAGLAQNWASGRLRRGRERHRQSSWCRPRTCAAQRPAMRQSTCDSLRRRSARVRRTSSFGKLTRSRAISTASRSLDAPRDVLASSRSRGSSQNVFWTFPIRVARGLDVVTRDRDEGRPVFESRRLDVGGTDPRYFVRGGVGQTGR